MKIWKLSIGKNEINNKVYENMKTMSIVSVYPDTAAKGQSNISQGANFLNAKEGDIFYVCRSNDSIEIIGMFKDSRPLVSLDKSYAEDGWVDREYELLFNAKENKNYDKDFDKWWMPLNNSTFIEIPPKEYHLFEKHILKPVFDNISIDLLILKRKKVLTNISMSLNKIQNLQKIFASIKDDQTTLFQVINKLDRKEINKLLYEYRQVEHIEKKPVVFLRKKIIEQLYEDKIIDINIVEKIKNDISQTFDTNVFHSWKDPFRILYTLYFAEFKESVKVYLDRFLQIIQYKLDIEEITDYVYVHFDGAQNQGNDGLWFAIYNATYKKHGKQKHAYQLFMTLYNGEFSYGLHHRDMPEKDIVEKNDNICFRDLISTYIKYVEIIRNDNSEEKAMLTEKIDLLEDQKQIILQGPPGTGKTRLAKQMARYMIIGEIADKIDDISEQVKLIQFHPSYSYEDFVRGITANTTKNGIEYKIENKILAVMANQAKKEFDKAKLESREPQPYVLIIDEINRANLSSVLGELIYALEYRNEAIESMYALKKDDQDKKIDQDKQREIILPKNLYIIGTMNTADRSIGHIDYAIRRRFTFLDILPNESVVSEGSKFVEVRNIFEEYLSPEFQIDKVMLGHSYFLSENENELYNKLRYQVIPLLKEYIDDGVLMSNALVKIEELDKES